MPRVLRRPWFWLLLLGLSATGVTGVFMKQQAAAKATAAAHVKPAVSPYTAIASGLTGTTYTHTGLPQVTRYYIVAAQNITGPGPDSTEASATPESAAFTAAELRGGTFTFTNGGITMTMTMPATIVGHAYQLQFTTDLVTDTWDDIGTAQTGTGTALGFPIPFAPGTQGFFRFILSR